MRLWSDIRRHPFISSFLLLLGIVLAVFAYGQGRMMQMAGYLAALAASVVVVDILATKFKTDQIDFNIKRPRTELVWLLSIQAIILAISVIRFQVLTEWQTMSTAAKLPVMALMALFVFPIVLLLRFLTWKYSLRDLGFRFRYFWIGLPVVLIFGLASFLAAPENNNFGANYRELGVPQMIFIGVFVAAAPEELVRYLTQSRLGAVMQNYAVGWLIASVIWAMLHLPGFYAQNTHGFVSAVWGVVAIIPLGLLWGFINHRTRSIIPAVVVHSTNLWGLHDF